MKLNDFERTVAEEVDRIPERFRSRIKNLAFTVLADPTPDQLSENDIPEGDTLLGLFDGTPLGEQGAGPWELQNRIIVFKHSTEAEAIDHGVPVREVIRETIWHEVAHYLGMDEAEVLAVEGRKKPYAR